MLDEIGQVGEEEDEARSTNIEIRNADSFVIRHPDESVIVSLNRDKS